MTLSIVVVFVLLFLALTCFSLSLSLLVSLLDVDLCGPSAPRMILGDAHTTHVVQKNDAAGTWTPVYAPCGNLAVMSISFMLQDHNQAVVWRGPRKNALIQQFLTQVDWTGDTQGLDYLLIDTPPGTSDEHISTVQYLQKANAVKGAIVVTTPEEVALADVRKELSFCSKTNVPVLGVIENMGTFTTPLSSLQFVDSATGQDATSTVLELLQTKCPEVLQNYQASCQLYGNNNNSTERGGGGAEQMAHDYNVPFWGRLPLDPLLLQACEKGQAFCKQEPNAPATKALQDFCNRLTDNLPVDMDE
jgi:Mrp family chromosome partitioning ATPase